MDEHPNATLARRLYEAFTSGDMSAMADLIAEDAVWHEIGNPVAIRGKAALAAHYAASTGDWGEYDSRLHDVIANDEHAIALVEATVTRNGRSLSYRAAEIYHLRDGKVTERWAFSDDTAAIVDFFA